MLQKSKNSKTYIRISHITKFYKTDPTLFIHFKNFHYPDIKLKNHLNYQKNKKLIEGGLK